MKVVHLLSQPDTERESRSIVEVRSVAALAGIPYHAMINPPHEGPIPTPRETIDRPFQLGAGHYGCWLAHKQAIEGHLNDDVDALLICECDCVFTEEHPAIVTRINRAYQACIEHDLLFFTFAYKHSSITLERLDDIILISQPVESHCYLVPLKSKPVFMELFQRPFDAYDFCLCHLYDWFKHRIGAFADRPIAVQATGPSLVDGKMKTSEDHYRKVKYQE